MNIDSASDRAWLQEQVQKKLSDYRYRHCVRTSQRAIELAQLHHADEVKAGVAGLVHDYAKECSDAEFIRIIQQEDLDPDLLNYGNAIWHGIVGAEIIKYDLGIYDEDILNAVRRHTTAAVHMTLLDKIVFMADYTESGRDFPEAATARKLTDQNLDAGVAYQIEHTLQHLLAKKQQIYPKTILSYNAWVVQSK
ncbi:bis(5'-nucleosyl)-tetraphosphatase (symmetrical) YqeK [Lactobacillus sp. DCY120]|uniref:bis(5'-nucleosyl)-tetraphosphatase (symmetrical) n=1 Tax=Bombilactobacillus apium TaxID=2675299 RepID=A0A850R1V4_9LACO|nr:bis(5'-nucleosyl)-tetraphosphatase (symmetrical) YqeK [Bombilactobacillus apium]NVY96903.1 bis(5'-nucleosyl)-tetraphosphatase (symmetrical) YqeK [Bombilactobacillus apium]